MTFLIFKYTTCRSTQSDRVANDTQKRWPKDMGSESRRPSADRSRCLIQWRLLLGNRLRESYGRVLPTRGGDLTVDSLTGRGPTGRVPLDREPCRERRLNTLL